MYLYVLVCMSKFWLVLQGEFNADILVQCHTVFPTKFQINAKIIVHTRTFSFDFDFQPKRRSELVSDVEQCASSPTYQACHICSHDSTHPSCSAFCVEWFQYHMLVPEAGAPLRRLDTGTIQTLERGLRYCATTALLGARRSGCGGACGGECVQNGVCLILSAITILKHLLLKKALSAIDGQTKPQSDHYVAGRRGRTRPLR